MDWKCSRRGSCAALRDHWESAQGPQRPFSTSPVRRRKPGSAIPSSCGVCYSSHLSSKVGVGLKTPHAASPVDAVGAPPTTTVLWTVPHHKHLPSSSANHVTTKCSESCSPPNLLLPIVCFLWLCLESLETPEHVHQQSCLTLPWKKFTEGSHKFRPGHGAQGLHDS